MSGETALGEFGTFDVENYGDLLYPVLLAMMFRQRNETREIRKFSFMGSKSLQASGYRTHPVRKLFSSSLERPHALMVGGGDILLADWNIVASHYRSICRRQKEKTPGWRRWLADRWRKPMDPDSEFRRRHMRYPAVAPFIIEPDGASKIRSVAYCSCGVPFAFDESVKPHVARAFNKSVFIYLRDRPSESFLIQAGVTREIHTAPDLIVALSDFFDTAREREKGRGILQKHGADIRRRILCFQSNPQTPENNAEILKQLGSYQTRTGCEVFLLPLGGCHGDREYLRQLAQDSGGGFKYVELYSIFDIIAAVAACDIFLGTSLHGNITAFSFGIPHLFGPIPLVKREGFLEMVNLPPEVRVDSWAETNQKLDLATGLGGEFFATRAAAAKRQVHAAVDLLLRAVTGRQASPVTAAARSSGGQAVS